MRSEFFCWNGSCPVRYVLVIIGSSNLDISCEKVLYMIGGMRSGVVAVDCFVLINSC